MVKRDRLIFEGIVIDDSNDRFMVKVNENHIVKCTLSGKIRKNDVRILLGDRVQVEVSEYDTNMGRIVFRMK